MFTLIKPSKADTMIITKEQQEALVSNYVKKGYGSDQCIGFIDGIEKIMEMIGKPTPQLSQSEVEKIAKEVYKNLVDGNVKDFAISHFKTGFTHPQKPQGEWYSKEQVEKLCDEAYGKGFKDGEPSKLIM